MMVLEDRARMMDEPLTPAISEAGPAPRKMGPFHRLASYLSARTICLCIMLASGVWMVALLVRGKPIEVQWIAQVLLAMAALLSSAWVSFEQLLHWRRPTRRLAEAIEEVRAGRLPIEELSTITGGITPVVLAVQDVFRDLRYKMADYARLEREIGHRVAHRTDALERLIGGLRQQAEHDALTGLHNRRALDGHLPQLIARCVADQTPLSLLMMDVDHFKQVNDTLGHAAGDALLRDVGGLIRSGIRDEDLAFRYGGDEFVIVLPGMEARDALQLGQRLARLMEGLARTIRVPMAPRLTVGLATIGELAPPTAAGLIERADQRLYAQKQARKSAPAA